MKFSSVKLLFCKIYPCLPALLAVLMVAWTWYCEPMLSRDGAFYAGQISEKLQTGKPFLHAFCGIPPLLQLISYGFCQFFVVPAGTAILLVNSVCLALMTIPMACIVRKTVHTSPLLVFFCTACLVTSPLLFQTVREGTREPLFLLCFLVTIAAALHSQGRYAMFWLGTSAAFGVFASLTRYEGVAGVIFSLIYVTFFATSSSLGKERLVRSLQFLLFAALTLGILCLLSTEIALFSGKMIKQIFRMATGRL